MNPFQLDITLPTETDILMIRSFRAPRPLVFKAFTDADYIRQWQGPNALKFTECSFDARPGGSWSMSQEDPDGNVFRFWGEVLEIEPPQRVVSTFHFEEYDPQINTSEFEEADGITKVTMRSVFKSKADRDGMLQSGMEGGMTEGFARLDALLAEQA